MIIKIRIPLSNQKKYLNRQFTKEGMIMAKEHMGGCTTSLFNREMEIKTAVHYSTCSLE